MEFKGRSLYNLLKTSCKEDPSLKVESWKILDYRVLSSEELFRRLRDLNISVTPESFILYAENCESPEDLSECLWIDEEDSVGEEKAYLLIFELWKRLCPDKRSLSVFCDELDELIILFEQQETEPEDSLQKALTELEDALDAGVDQGLAPREVFQVILRYTAHDLEDFLYDYIQDLLDQGNEVTASELIDAFHKYVPEKKWFDLLRARLFSLSNVDESAILVQRILEEEESDFIFLSELGEFLVHREDCSLFLECIKKMLHCTKFERDLQEVLHILSEFFLCLDNEPREKEIEEILKERKDLSLDIPVRTSDVRMIEQFLSEHIGSAF